MKYIKSNSATGVSEEIIVNATANTVFDISNDSDDDRYTFDTFEDYKFFVDHLTVE